MISFPPERYCPGNDEQMRRAGLRFPRRSDRWWRRRCWTRKCSSSPAKRRGTTGKRPPISEGGPPDPPAHQLQSQNRSDIRPIFRSRSDPVLSGREIRFWPKAKSDPPVRRSREWPDLGNSWVRRPCFQTPHLQSPDWATSRRRPKRRERPDFGSTQDRAWVWQEVEFEELGKRSD